MWRNARTTLSLCAVVALAAGCSAGHSPAAFPHGAGLSAHRKALTLPKYVIVMVQENRTVDNLFQTQPGVDTQNFGFDSHNNRVPLKAVGLGAPYSCSHSHATL